MIHKKRHFSLVILTTSLILWGYFLGAPMLYAKNGDTFAKIEIPSGAKTAIFAGGCFWCMEPPFEKIEGVYEAYSGYTDGKEQNPTYQQVASGATGHTEAILVVYDPKKVDYQKLLEVFWRSFDPTDSKGQFADRGPQYRPGIYFASQEEEKMARESAKALDASGRFDKPIATEIKPASQFWPAEEYHQDYYEKNPVHYWRYRIGSGRAGFIEDKWS